MQCEDLYITSRNIGESSLYSGYESSGITEKMKTGNINTRQQA